MHKGLQSPLYLKDLEAVEGLHVHQQQAIQADFVQRMDAHLAAISPRSLQQSLLQVIKVYETYDEAWFICFWLQACCESARFSQVICTSCCC